MCSLTTICKFVFVSWKGWARVCKSIEGACRSLSCCLLHKLEHLVTTLPCTKISGPRTPIYGGHRNTEAADTSLLYTIDEALDSRKCSSAETPQLQLAKDIRHQDEKSNSANRPQEYLVKPAATCPTPSAVRLVGDREKQSASMSPSCTDVLPSSRCW